MLTIALKNSLSADRLIRKLIGQTIGIGGQSTRKSQPAVGSGRVASISAPTVTRHGLEAFLPLWLRRYQLKPGRSILWRCLQRCSLGGNSSLANALNAPLIDYRAGAICAAPGALWLTKRFLTTEHAE